MKQMLTTPSEENYIEWIYRFSLEGSVRPTDIAEKLGVKKPSVTKAVASLVRKGLLEDSPRGKMVLTEAGKRVGAAVVRRDACLTALLVEVLSMTPEAADQEVHRLEHVLSDVVLERLETLVSFACSSPAWLKRLHFRMEQSMHVPAPAQGAYDVGHTPVHSGCAKEKMSAPDTTE